MKRVIRLIVYLLLGIFITDRLVGILLESAYSQKPSRNIGALYHIIDQEKPYDQLVLGSSRALYGVMPELLTERSFNMGWDGTAIDMHLALLKFIESHEKLPKTILLSLDDKMVFDTGTEFTALEELSVLYDQNDWLTGEINKRSKYNRFLYFFHTYKFNDKVFSLLSSTDKFDNNEARGFIPLKSTSKGSLNVEKLISRRYAEEGHHNRESLDLSPLFLSNLTELIALVKAHDIKLILFSPPLYGPRFYKYNQEKLNNLLCKHGIIYLDYQNQFRVDQDALSASTFWKDLSHLSYKGARVFTKQLNRDITDLINNVDSLPQALKNCK